MTTDGDGDGPDDPAWLKELAAQRQGRSAALPRGRAVSSALILPPGTLPRDRQLLALLATIDAVHFDGDLPSLPVRWGVLPLRFVALYRTSSDERDSISLTIDPRRARWLLATVHEVGHFLDHRGIGAPSRFASPGSRLLREWRTTARRSRALSALLSFRNADPYFGRAEELWARSYAQWIALRSGDETLQRQVIDLREGDPGDPPFYLQWDEDDFDPIAGAIDRLFRRLGWLS